MRKKQKTISKSCSIEGIGLHTGVKSRLTFHPAAENFGIKFKRSDIKNSPAIDATIENVIDLKRSTTIGVNNVEIHTVEHVMAAVYGLEISNLLIEVNNIEVPVIDGSSKPFVDILIESGLSVQSKERDEIEIKEVIKYSNPESQIDIHVLPSESFKVTFMADYEQRSIGTQYAAIYSLKEQFKSEIAPARTFGLLSELKSLKKAGLIKGGSLDNAIIFSDEKLTNQKQQDISTLFKYKKKLFIDNNGILNGTPLRFPNEPVRHKILDLIGDFSLIGAYVKGHIIAARSGHASNIEVLKRIRSMHMKKKINKNIKKFDINQIIGLMQHRYPFLLIDRITDLKVGKEVTAIKNVTINEPFFNGHFPDFPVMPGVLIIEAMAQAGGFLILNSIDDPSKKSVFLSSIKNSKFIKTVHPGDQLIFNVKFVKFKLNTVKIVGEASVDKVKVAEAEMLATVVPR
tara:strand:+ start:269 stop:1642 length:1374 start_codon:yes stop_codon:yes gene_type:complete